MLKVNNDSAQSSCKELHSVNAADINRLIAHTLFCLNFCFDFEGTKLNYFSA